MTRRIMLSVAFAVALGLIGLLSSGTGTQAQRNRLYRFDTGVVALGPDQRLRVTVSPTGGPDAPALNVRFTRQTYEQGACSNGVCPLAVTGEQTSPVLSVPSGEAASVDMAASHSRVQATLGSPNARVTVQVIDASAGKTVSLVSSADFDTL